MSRRASSPMIVLCCCLIALGAVVAQEADAPAEPAPPAAEMVWSPGEGVHYWPRWRGPTGQGIALGEGYPDRWSTHENILWKVEVPGEDNSSPIVWGDRIFLVTTETVGEDRARKILCYGAEDGSLLWEAVAPIPRFRLTQRRSDFSIATPVTDGKQVYAYLGAYGLFVVDFDGKQKWHRGVGTFDHATSSPLLHENKLIIVQIAPSRKGSYLSAFDAANGAPLWQEKRADGFACGSPIAVRVGDEDQVVISGQEYVKAYSPSTGRQKWMARGTTNTAIPTPVVGFGMVYVTSGHAGTTMAVFPTGSGNVTRTHVAWREEEKGTQIPSPLFYDGYLYVINDSNGQLTCYDGGTGEVIWRKALADARSGGFAASPVVAEDKIFVTDISGTTYVIQPGPEFRLLGTNSLKEAVRASPALSQGRWYFRTAEHLIAIAAME